VLDRTVTLEAAMERVSVWRMVVAVTVVAPVMAVMIVEFFIVDLKVDVLLMSWLDVIDC